MYIVFICVCLGAREGFASVGCAGWANGGKSLTDCSRSLTVCSRVACSSCSCLPRKMGKENRIRGLLKRKSLRAREVRSCPGCAHGRHPAPHQPSSHALSLLSLLWVLWLLYCYGYVYTCWFDCDLCVTYDVL